MTAALKVLPQKTDLPAVLLTSSNRAEAVRAVIPIAKAASNLFVRAGMLVSVVNGAAHVLNETDILLWLSDHVAVKKMVKIDEGFTEVRINPSKVFMADLLSELPKHMPPLIAVITTQTICRDGRILDKAGYDKETGIYLYSRGKLPEVPKTPTVKQVLEAADNLMKPFAEFGYVEQLDYSVKLAAMLSVVVRADVPTRPVIAYDAPVMGSGKTLLAKCDAALADAGEASIWPWTSGGEEETRKRLAAGLLKGSSVIVWDNILGAFNSASFAAAITANDYEDRILGKSQSFKVANKTQFILTGNNIDLYGDMPRRVLRCRIDPNTDKPFSRSFRQNPYDFVMANRQQMAVWAITIIRGWMTTGKKARATGNLASFEDWDNLVRQPVAWLARLQPDKYEDPMKRIAEEVESDPETELLNSLLTALQNEFGVDGWFTAAEVGRVINTPSGKSSAIYESLRDIRGARQINELTGRTIGRILVHRKDRIADGKRLRISQTGKHAAKFKIESTNE